MIAMKYEWPTFSNTFLWRTWSADYLLGSFWNTGSRQPNWSDFYSIDFFAFLTDAQTNNGRVF